MNTASDILVHRMARNYLQCLADFPADLRPAHLTVPTGEQDLLFAGLYTLRSAIRAVYEYFAYLPVEDALSGGCTEEETCWKTIEEPLKLLWALGTAGRLVSAPDGLSLLADRAELDACLKSRGVKHPQAAFDILAATGFQIIFRASGGATGGEPCPGGYKKCSVVSVSYPRDNQPLLLALIHFAAALPVIKNGPPFEIFLRADFRALLPGYQYAQPHLPVDENEVTSTITNPAVREMWRDLSEYAVRKYPKYRRFYRVPHLRSRGWTTDYSKTGKDYGLWSIISDEQGLRLRIVLKAKGYQYLLNNINELSPRYQEIFLTKAACSDCTHCGKHIFYQHGDHTHRLCKGPWYCSPYIEPEDMPDIERIIDIQVENLK